MGNLKNFINLINFTNSRRAIILSVFIIVLFIAFTSPLSPPPPSGWYQQFMPNLGGRQITDVSFLDSLTGYAVTNSNGQFDTAFVLKTVNGGDNWFINYSRTAWFTGFNKIKFLNQDTGFICGVSVSGGPKGLTKTTNGGVTWFDLDIPDPYLNYLDMSILNTDTIWLISSSNPTGGVFRTTNGGASWDHQINLGSDNPDHIYMFNGRLGFIAKLQVYLRRTTDGGATWTIDTTGSDSGFREMYFVDSLTGWKTSLFGIRKTTNGGLNWFLQQTAQGGIIQSNGIRSFSNINRDTIWGTGGYVIYPNNQVRVLLNRTTNGGDNWLFQIPDTSIFMSYYYINFVNKFNGWATSNARTEIHTTVGGDTTFYTGIQQTPYAVPEGFVLKQNYPNPFNPRTVIPYSINSPAHVKIIAYDITGREVQRMVDNYQQAGAYEVDFMGKFTASGVYFYRMIVTDEKGRVLYMNTKKMILIK